MFRKTVVFIVMLLAAFSLAAQEVVQFPGGQGRRPVVPCPHPFSQTLSGGTSGPTSVVLSDLPPSLQAAVTGSVWNQTATNKHFAHTIRVPKGDCCVFTGGTLTVTIKALNSGGVGASGANNDAIHVFSGGQKIDTKQPWLTTGVTAGATATATIAIPASALENGTITTYVQDDSAVVSIQLVAEGCCIRKQK